MFSKNDLEDEITMEKSGVEDGSEIYLHNRHPINPKFPRPKKE